MKTRCLALMTAALLMTACETTTYTRTTQGLALTGTAARVEPGAVVAEDDDRLKGVLIGATPGAVAATMIGRAKTPGNCIYRDMYGRTLIAPC